MSAEDWLWGENWNGVVVVLPPNSVVVLSSKSVGDCCCGVWLLGLGVDCASHVRDPMVHGGVVMFELRVPSGDGRAG